MSSGGSIPGSRVLVVGGEGWIGSRVVAMLREAGAEVMVSDITIHRPVASFYGVAPGAPDTYVDAVVYMAGPTVPEAEALVNVDRDLRTLILSLRLARTALVYASSTWVYSSSGLLEASPFARLALPRDGFTAMKVAGEALVHASPLRTAILRYGLGYGEGQQPYMPLPTIVRDVDSGGEFKVFGAEDDVRHLCHVDDMARAAVLALDATMAGTVRRGVFDIVGPAITLREMVQLVGGYEALGRATFVRPDDGDLCRTSFKTDEPRLMWENRKLIHAGILEYARSVRT